MGNTEQNIGDGPLYKIGTGWVFNTDTCIGYKVVRAGSQRDSKVIGFSEAFKIRKEENNYNVDYGQEIPMGVVRKAIHLIELRDSGELVRLGDKFKHNGLPGNRRKE